MSAADPRSHELAELRQCGYRLALAFGRDAEAADDAIGRQTFFELFDRCFFAVRMATVLELRLRRAPDQGVDRRRVGEGKSDRGEPADRELPERDLDLDGGALPHETDRERESEPASRTALLRTLDGSPPTPPFCRSPRPRTSQVFNGF